MKTLSIKHWIFLALLAFGAAAVAVIGQDGINTSMVVTGAWARPGDEMTAVYLQIANTGDDTDELITVETSSGTAEIHQTQLENDVMRMRPVTAISVAAGETVVLEPGGYHIMLMDLRAPLTNGDTLRLTLHFVSGIVVEAEAYVSSSAAPHVLEADTLTVQALAARAEEIYVGQIVDPPVQVQDFVAPSSNAEFTRLSDTDGKWRVIFFGYMHCPDFCPLTLADYQRVKSLLGGTADAVTFMFISVDAVRDTPDAVRRYLDNFDPEFIGFSPDDITLKRIQPDYGFYYERRMDSGNQAIYSVDHSTRSYLLGRDGVLRASFAYDTEPQMIADALLWYLGHE